MGAIEGKRTILVVDDDPAVRTYVRSVLQRQQFEVLEAEDGVDACELLKCLPPWKVELLITDIKMPRMDGIALGQKISVDLPNTLVLYISGFAEKQPADLRNKNFLSKPFTPAALIRVVQDLCSKRHRR